MPHQHLEVSAPWMLFARFDNAVVCRADVVFWLIGANAPIMKIHFKKKN
jgi:hypothetical protein